MLWKAKYVLWWLIIGNILQKQWSVIKNGFQEYMKSIGKLGGQNKIPDSQTTGLLLIY
jgi:hypothetical protein